MQTATPAPISPTAVRYGVLIGLVSIIYTFITFATEQEGNQLLAWGSLVIIPVIGIFLAHKAFKQVNAGFMAYGQGLGIGVVASLVAGALTTLFSYIYRTFIDPDMPARMLEAARAKLEEAGTMSEAQVNQMLAMTTKFSTGPLGIAVGLLTTVVLGFIFSLVIAAITKNAKPEFE